MTDGLQQAIVGVPLSGHAPFYQRVVYIARGQSFIGGRRPLMHSRTMARDVKFGARLKAAMIAAGFKSARKFATEGLGWSEDNGPQRLNNYLKGRVPDYETLRQLAQVLKLAPSSLLSEGVDDGLRDILLQLLVLEGIPDDKADTLASAALEARRLLETFPDDDPLPTRAKFAARAAWHQRRSPAHGK